MLSSTEYRTVGGREGEREERQREGGRERLPPLSPSPAGRWKGQGPCSSWAGLLARFHLYWPSASGSLPVKWRPQRDQLHEGCLGLREHPLAFTVVMCNCSPGTSTWMATGTPVHVYKETVLCPSQHLVLESPPYPVPLNAQAFFLLSSMSSMSRPPSPTWQPKHGVGGCPLVQP